MESTRSTTLLTVFGAAAAGVGGRCRTVQLDGDAACETGGRFSRETMNHGGRHAAPGGDRLAGRAGGGDAVVGAARGGSGYGWDGAGAADAGRHGADRKGLTDLKDFSTARALLACPYDPADTTVCHTLLLLHRKGADALCPS